MKSRSWILIFAAFLVVLSAVVFLQQQQTAGHIANIYQDNVCIQSIDLNEVKETYSFTVSNVNGHKNTITVGPGRICVSDANCPDRICVHTGWIASGTKPIVCLPARLVIQIEREGTDQDIDGMVG